MKCWYCRKKTMEEASDLGRDWFRCSECGVTWIDTSKMGGGGALFMGTPWGGKYAISRSNAERMGII